MNANKSAVDQDLHVSDLNQGTPRSTAVNYAVFWRDLNLFGKRKFLREALPNGFKMLASVGYANGDPPELVL